METNTRHETDLIFLCCSIEILFRSFGIGPRKSQSQNKPSWMLAAILVQILPGEREGADQEYRYMSDPYKSL